MNWNSLLLDIKYNIDRNRLKSQSNKLDYSNERINLHYITLLLKQSNRLKRSMNRYLIIWKIKIHNKQKEITLNSIIIFINDRYSDKKERNETKRNDLF